MESYLSQKVKKGIKSAIHGRGLFALLKIAKGEIVAIKSGRIVTKKQLSEISTQLHAEMQISDDLFIAPTNEEEFEKSMICLNHSCNPNLGIRGDIVFVALRDIAPEEELTVDYAMMDNVPDTQFSCVCASSECRKVITGHDWKKIEVQRKYQGYFSAYISSLIAKTISQLD